MRDQLEHLELGRLPLKVSVTEIRIRELQKLLFTALG